MMLPIQKMISKYNNASRNGDDIKYIVLHYTANKGDNARNNAIYFNGGDRQASAHYFVSDKEIYQVVEDNRASWAVGDGRGKNGITNQNSLSIEMCCWIDGTVSETTENNVIPLVQAKMKEYNIPIERVVRHYDASGKMCPNWSANNWERWNNFKNKLIGEQVENIIVTTKPQESTDELYRVRKTWNDSQSQKGAYKDLNNAKECAKKYGLKIFNSKGEEIIDEPKKETKPTVEVKPIVNKVITNKEVKKVSKLLEKVKYKQVSYGKSGSHVFLLQSILTELGYNVNGIDGHCGNGLKQAIMKYQRNNGLTVDGSCYIQMWTHILTN